MTTTDVSTAAPVAADEVAATTLLGVVVRELAGPAGHVTLDGDRMLVRLHATGELLRARVRRRSAVGAHRITTPERRVAGAWTTVGAHGLAGLVAAELARRTGRDNPEFAAQVGAGRDALARIAAERPAGPSRPVGGFAGGYLDSEQALLVGHPRHPAPKWRSGSVADWRRHAPELRTAFPLRWLAVPRELVADHGTGFDEAAGAVLGGRVPDGRLAVPVHPWQFRMLSADPRLGPEMRGALRAGTLRDLGEAGLPVHPTASVRTVYQPEVDVFLKTGLNVRITNCVRRNSASQLAGAVALTDLVAGPVAEVARRSPGFAVLAEPAARTVAGPLGDSLGVIARCGLAPHVGAGERVHLAGTLAAEHPDPAGTRTRLADLCGWDPVLATRWWGGYVALLVPPVLALWARHGIVLEPHLQNVLVVVDADGMPVRVLVRDLEGAKLVTDRHGPALAALPPDVSRGIGYDAGRGWRRVAYCLLVNNLVEVAGALADLGADEARLWDVLAGELAAASAELGDPAPLRAVLAGHPLPAKANLLVRWARAADRDAGYVPFAHPLGGSRQGAP